MDKQRGIDASIPDLQHLFDAGAISDGQLLDRFVDRREGVVFEAIIHRHGPMVWGVCRRILRDHHDAEDAFQATFLVLARKAASVMPRAKVGNWLYGVAYQTARKARAMKAKRRLREVQVPDRPDPGAVRGEQLDDLRPQLDRELSRLPDKYRVPIVLCELEGKSHREAAEQLGWPIGTVSGRLSRARVILARRLSRPGVALSGGSLAVLLTQDAASAGVPAGLIRSMAHAARLFTAGQAMTAGMVSVEVAALTGEVLKTMLLFKITTVGLLIGVAGLGGSGIFYYSQAAGGATQARQVAGQKSPTAPARAADPAGEKLAPADEVTKLQGTWQAVELEANGKKVTKDAAEVKGMRLVFKDDGITLPSPVGDGRDRKKQYKLDAAKSPKEIDITSLDGQEKDQTAACIYKLEKDRLTICFSSNKDANTRPKEFKAGADEGFMLITLERVKGK